MSMNQGEEFVKEKNAEKEKKKCKFMLYSGIWKQNFS